MTSLKSESQKYNVYKVFPIQNSLEYHNRKSMTSKTKKMLLGETSVPMKLYHS